MAILKSPVGWDMRAGHITPLTKARCSSFSLVLGCAFQACRMSVQLQQNGVYPASASGKLSDDLETRDWTLINFGAWYVGPPRLRSSVIHTRGRTDFFNKQNYTNRTDPVRTVLSTNFDRNPIPKCQCLPYIFSMRTVIKVKRVLAHISDLPSYPRSFIF